MHQLIQLHPFINNYFKNNIDSINEFYNKVKNMNKNMNKNIKNNDVYTIYIEDEEFYVIKNNDITTATHLSLFKIEDIINMKLSSNVNRDKLENFILSKFNV